MTTKMITSLATADVAALTPTFRVKVTVTAKTLTLSTTVTDGEGRTSVLSVSASLPTDPVLRDTGRLLNRLACRVNDARHMGLMVA